LLILVSAALVFSLSKDRYVRLILVSLLLICPFIIIVSARIRMEALSILLISLSIVSVKRQWPAYITGIIAGLGAMTHPLVYACCAGLALYNLRRGWKPFLLFGITALLVVSPYLYYILQSFEFYKIQMDLQLVRKASTKLTDLKLDYIIQLVPMSLAGFAFLYFTKKEREFRIFLGASLALTVFITLKSSEFNYQVNAVPYILAATGLFLEERKERLYRLAVPVLLFTFFLALLGLKARKYNFQTDAEHKQLIGYLSTNKSWEGKRIFVTGDYDVSTHFILNHQNVERKNAVAAIVSNGWTEKYDYVVAVVEKGKEKQLEDGLFWRTWDQQTSFTTSNGNYTLYTASRNVGVNPGKVVIK
jgi:hypothetical protein